LNNPKGGELNCSLLERQKKSWSRGTKILLPILEIP